MFRVVSHDDYNTQQIDFIQKLSFPEDERFYDQRQLSIPKEDSEIFNIMDISKRKSLVSDRVKMAFYKFLGNRTNSYLRKYEIKEDLIEIDALQKIVEYVEGRVTEILFKAELNAKFRGNHFTQNKTNNQIIFVKNIPKIYQEILLGEKIHTNGIINTNENININTNEKNKIIGEKPTRKLKLNDDLRNNILEVIKPYNQKIFTAWYNMLGKSEITKFPNEEQPQVQQHQSLYNCPYRDIQIDNVTIYSKDIFLALESMPFILNAKQFYLLDINNQMCKKNIPVENQKNNVAMNERNPNQMQIENMKRAQMNSPLIIGAQMNNPQMMGMQMNNPQMMGMQMNNPQMRGMQMNNHQMIGGQINSPPMIGTQMKTPPMMGGQMNNPSMMRPQMNNPSMMRMQMNNHPINGAPMASSTAIRTPFFCNKQNQNNNNDMFNS